MGQYQQVLVAVDLTDEAAQVLSKANAIAQSQKAELTVITVIRPLNYAYAGLDMTSLSRSNACFELEAKDHAERILQELTQDIEIPQDNVRVLFGIPAPQIKTYSTKIGADLIVLGTHGRHGLGLILGSTANGVLHGTECDVLAVRVDPIAPWLAD